MSVSKAGLDSFGIRRAHLSGMKTGDICTKDVVFVDRETIIQQAALTMREEHVGDLIVVDSAKHAKKPVGILTDRDIVLAVVAPKLDPSLFTVGDVMSQGIMTAPADQDIFDTVHAMRLRGVRRVPVVDKDGEITGVFALDDFVSLLAREMDEVAKLILRERDKETRSRL
jgi:CBS domain-containing protein